MRGLFGAGKGILILGLTLAPPAIPQKSPNYRDTQIDGFMSDSKVDRAELRAKLDTLIQLNSQANEHLKYNDARLDEMAANNKWFISILLGALGIGGANLHATSRNREVIRRMRNREDDRGQGGEDQTQRYSGSSI